MVAGLGAQKFPDKTAELSGDGYHGFVAQETSPEETVVTTVQTKLSTPADGTHLMRLTLLAPAEVRRYFGRRGVMLGAFHQ